MLETAFNLLNNYSVANVLLFVHF